MRKVITLAAVLAATIATSLPVQAQNVTFSFGNRARVIETYCDRNPWDRDCRGYYNGNWGYNDYNTFYSRRRGDLDSIAAGLFGLTFGAIIGGAIANSNNNSSNDRLVGPTGGMSSAHIQACQARFRSYDVASDTYLGYDGDRHRCNL